MTNRNLRLFISLLVSLSLIYTPILRADQLALPSADLVAPVVKHHPIENTPTAGLSQNFSAIVTDNVGVKSVTLFYRPIGSKQYQQKSMKKVGDTDEYLAILDADEMKAPGIEYYIQASDLAGNNLLHGYSFSPLVVNVSPAAAKPAEEVSFAPEEDKEISNWVWIGLGVLAVAAAAGGGGGGGGSSSSSDGTVVVSAPLP